MNGSVAAFLGTPSPSLACRGILAELGLGVPRQRTLAELGLGVPGQRTLAELGLGVPGRASPSSPLHGATQVRFSHAA